MSYQNYNQRPRQSAASAGTRSSRAGYRSSKAPVPRYMPVWKLIVIDLLAVGVGLIVFALFHHVIDFSKPQDPVILPAVSAAPTEAPALTLPPVEAETSSPEDPAESTSAPEPTEPPRIYSGVWGEKFADKFTTGEVIQTENSYQSENVNVTFTRHEEPGLIYHVAEIYISDLKYLKAGFGGGKYGGGTQMTNDIAVANNAIVAISGDHYTGRKEGTVVRNGVLYRESAFEDVCVLNNDGTMETFSNQEFDLQKIKTEGAYQVWSFGPMLLKDGQPLSSFTTTVGGLNPRSAIGYVEPGHYFFVQVDGRDKNGSKGLAMADLAKLFSDLGCKVAYNLDGGASSGISWKGQLISYPYNRSVGDIIYIADNVAE